MLDRNRDPQAPRLLVVRHVQARERGEVHEREAAALGPVVQAVTVLRRRGVGEPEREHAVPHHPAVRPDDQRFAALGREPLDRMAIQGLHELHASILPLRVGLG
jgi:hypothetical protein